MTRYYCDRCETEITDKNRCFGGHNTDSRLGTEIKFNSGGQPHTLRVEIIHALDGCFNDGLFCKYCVLDAIIKLDDRVYYPSHKTAP